MGTGGVELLQYRYGGYYVQIEAIHRNGQLTASWYQATRDDGLCSHIHIEPGPYDSRQNLIDTVEALIERA